MADNEKQNQQQQPPAPAPAASKTQPKTPYVVTGFVKHDGEEYEAGEGITLSPKEAEALLKVGAIKKREE